MFHGTHWMFSGWMWLFWIILIAAIIYLIVRMSKPSAGNRQDETALDLLDKRLARGELSEEEYRAKKRAILENHRIKDEGE